MALANFIQKAMDLEMKGHWRRAQRQWLIVYDKTHDVHYREEILRRRDFCAGRAQKERAS